MNMNILAVDIKHLSTYDFLQDSETEEQLLQRANESKERDIKSWEENSRDYPCELYDNYLKIAKDKEYRIMTWDEFEKLQRDFYIGQPISEITEEVFDDMLNVLPPLKWCTIDGIEMFCMSEMYSGSYTNQYAYDKRTNKYYTKMVDCMDKTTWINTFLA